MSTDELLRFLAGWTIGVAIAVALILGAAWWLSGRAGSRGGRR